MSTNEQHMIISDWPEEECLPICCRSLEICLVCLCILRKIIIKILAIVHLGYLCGPPTVCRDTRTHVHLGSASDGDELRSVNYLTLATYVYTILF